MRSKIKNLIESISPYDDLESTHIFNAKQWIDSGEEIFRQEKPATPPKHLVSYFVPVDVQSGKLLLVDHVNAGLLLPPGGHVDKDEHPKGTVEREMLEELFLAADFIQENPVFLTQTVTVGKTAGHTDVCFWYLVRGNSEAPINYDKREFNGYEWFTFAEVLNAEIVTLDPHMHRFIKKLIGLI